MTHGTPTSRWEDRIVEIWTDGACSMRGNTGRGPGGWAAVLRYDEKEKRLSGRSNETTNNQMELLAIIRGLGALKKGRRCTVKVYTDSAYIVNSVNRGWLANWQRHGWRTTAGKPVANQGHWDILSGMLRKHNVEFIKVRGHSNNEGNNLADDLAYMAAREAS